MISIPSWLANSLAHEVSTCFAQLGICNPCSWLDGWNEAQGAKVFDFGVVFCIKHSNLEGVHLDLVIADSLVCIELQSANIALDVMLKELKSAQRMFY